MRELERLECYRNFDYSDIRLVTNEKDNDDNGGFVLARCHKDHIEIITRSWISEFRYLENILFVLNHESLHVPIERALMEDGFDWMDYDGEWMFYAGGMDELNGLSTSKTTPVYYLGQEAIENTLKCFPQNSFLCKQNLQGDYDL